MRPRTSEPPTEQPQTIAEFVDAALSNPPTPPTRPEQPKRPPARPSGIWADMTPEQRTAHAKKLAAMRKPENMKRPHKRKRGPRGWAVEDANKAKAEAQIKAQEMVNHLIETGRISPDDQEGAQATAKALARLNTPGGDRREKIRAARRLVHHYHPELAVS